ncbi:hypothetical protein [Streptomyces sp. NPDC052042]|uniref:hypothetical protein n=1 Tax=Streptomyces sp. NPDC052042 TaxID=3365683 RepID=UPI0037D1E954
MTFPVLPLSALSEDAQLLYSRRSLSGTLTLDRDWFDQAAPRMSQYALRPEYRLDPEFTPDERLADAVRELVDAGYAWHSGAQTYGLQRIDTELFTVADGEGPWDVSVYQVDRPGSRSSDGRLIAELRGATLSTHDETSQLTIDVQVPDARDEEHDPAYAALIELLLPSFPKFSGRMLSFWGIAGNTHLYPFGTTPTLLDRMFKPIERPEWCTYEHCQGGNGRERHMIAPYQPPTVDLSSAVLYVEARIGEPHPPTP